jgi:hypothetical protein
LTAAEQQQNGHDPHVHGYGGEYHSPQTPQAPAQTGFPSRPPSSGPHPPYSQPTPVVHYAPPEPTTLPRENLDREKALGA